MAKNVYRDSPFGPVEHPHFNKPDDKFNKENPPYHGTLVLEGDVALAFKELVDTNAQAAYDAFMADGDGSKLPKAKQKEWSVYTPYEVEYQDDGETPTGRIKFDFKQNSVIRTADGTKHVEIGLYDAEGGEMNPAKDFVRHGSVVRLRHSFRAITLKTNKQVGTRMDFSMVQVKEMAQGNGGGFGAVEGGGYKRKAQDAPDDAGDEAPFSKGTDSAADGDY